MRTTSPSACTLEDKKKELKSASFIACELFAELKRARLISPEYLFQLGAALQ